MNKLQDLEKENKELKDRIKKLEEILKFIWENTYQ